MSNPDACAPGGARVGLAAADPARHSPAVDAFSYLSVLLSIILGLAITQVLAGYRALLLARARVTLYWPSLIWSVLILLMATQNWWASFGLATRGDWYFGAFATILVQVVLLYMLAAIVLPDMPHGETVDLRAHYYREQRPFFGIAAALIVSSIAKDVILDGTLPEPANLAFHLLFWAASVVAIVVKSPRYHELLAPVMAVILGSYVTLLFARLA